MLASVAFFTITAQLTINPDSFSNPIIFVLMFVLLGMGMKQFILGIKKMINGE
jgi:Sec-independent protein secretion pathway component TatC